LFDRAFGGLILDKFALPRGGLALRSSLLGLRRRMDMVVAAARAVDMPFLGLEVGLELGAGRGAVADLGLAEQEVDDLVLVERSAQLGGRHRLLLDVADEGLAVLGLVLRSSLH